LVLVKDKPLLESLVKKLKRQQLNNKDGCWKHGEVWEKAVLAYAKVLRYVNNLGDNLDLAVFENVTYDEFTTFSQKLEEYVENPENQTEKAFEVLKDAFELKKLNTGLTKTVIIDDLLSDAYSVLYQTMVPEIITKLAGSTPAPAVVTSPSMSANPMSLHNLVEGTQQPTPTPSNAVALAAAHSKIDDYLGRRMTKIGRKDVLQKVNAMFRTLTVCFRTPLTAP
jgi:hypothetical protein